MEILFTQLSPVEMSFMASGILCAAVMRAFTGFGFALMAVPLLSLFLLPTDAVVLVALLTLTTSLVTYRAWWGRFGLSDGLPMVGGSIVGTGMGVIFLTQLSLAQFQLWIGLIVIFLCLVLSRFKPKHHVGGPGIAAGTGLLSGLMNGAFAIPGPPVIIYAMACIPEPANSRGFLMAFFMMSSLISLTTFTVSGLVTTTPFYLLMLSLPAMLMGDRLGTWLFLRIGGQAYRPVALVVSLGVGLAITVKALFAMGFTV